MDKKAPNTKLGEMQFTNSYCKICEHTYHATKDFRSKSKVEEEMDDDKDIGDGYHNQNDDEYNDVLQAFFVESLSATTPNPSNVKDMVSRN